jgi:hypothetical protein
MTDHEQALRAARDSLRNVVSIRDFLLAVQVSMRKLKFVRVFTFPVGRMVRLQSLRARTHKSRSLLAFVSQKLLT